MPTVRQTAEVTISDLSDAANVSLTSYSFVFGANKNGAATAGSCTFGASCFIGATQVDCSIDNSAITVPSAGVSTQVNKATGSMSPVVTVTVNSNLTQTVLNTSAIITVPVSFTYQGQTVTINKDFSLALAKTGATGSAAYNYFLNASPTAIVRAEGGTLSTSSIAWNSTRATTGNPSSYSGYVWSHYTTDGSTWTQIAKASSAASSGTVTIPSSATATVKAVRITLHTASPTDANKVDVVTIPIVDEGATGPQGEPAYTVLLTNEAHTFPATADGKAVAGSVTTSVVAYKGATSVTPTIGTITGQTTGQITASASGANITVTVTTSLTTRSGELTIPVTVDGKSFTKKFSWSLAPTGATGEQGPQGEGGLSMSITSNNGTTLRNNSGNTTLTAHVWQDGAEVTGNDLSALGTIKWYKDGTYQSGKDGATITVSATDVTNKAVYTAKLEG